MTTTERLVYKVTERCGCGATYEAESSLPTGYVITTLDAVNKALASWRADHKHEVVRDKPPKHQVSAKTTTLAATTARPGGDVDAEDHFAICSCGWELQCLSSEIAVRVALEHRATEEQGD